MSAHRNEGLCECTTYAILSTYRSRHMHGGGEGPLSAATLKKAKRYHALKIRQLIDSHESR